MTIEIVLAKHEIVNRLIATPSGDIGCSDASFHLEAGALEYSIAAIN